MLDGKEIEVKKIFCKVLKSIFASDLSRWILRMLQNFAVIAVLKVYILLLLLVIACNKTLWTYNNLKLPFANHVFRGLALGCAWSTRPAHGAISSRRPRIRIKKNYSHKDVNWLRKTPSIIKGQQAGVDPAWGQGGWSHPHPPIFFGRGWGRRKRGGRRRKREEGKIRRRNNLPQYSILGSATEDKHIN